MVAAWDSKYGYSRKRPSEVDGSLATELSNPRSPSYPAEHAVAAGAAAAVLSYLFPDRASYFAEAARAYALQNIASIDTGIACWDSKYAYWAIRPFQLDLEVKPLFSTPNHPSYPAAHGCLSTATAAILGYLFPRDAATLTALTEEANESRIWAGIHYRSDTVAGAALGRAVANKVIDRARKDGSQ
jgi:membrane-associated phospholipid phosphatase